METSHQYRQYALDYFYTYVVSMADETSKYELQVTQHIWIEPYKGTSVMPVKWL